MDHLIKVNLKIRQTISSQPPMVPTCTEDQNAPSTSKDVIITMSPNMIGASGQHAIPGASGSSTMEPTPGAPFFSEATFRATTKEGWL